MPVINRIIQARIGIEVAAIQIHTSLEDHQVSRDKASVAVTPWA